MSSRIGSKLPLPYMLTCGILMTIALLDDSSYYWMTHRSDKGLCDIVLVHACSLDRVLCWHGSVAALHNSMRVCHLRGMLRSLAGRLWAQLGSTIPQAFS